MTEDKHYVKISPAELVVTHGEDTVTVPRIKLMALYEAICKVPKLKDGEEKTFELVPKDTSSSSSDDPYPGSPEWFDNLIPKK